VGGPIKAFILVNTEVGREHEIAEKIRRLGSGIAEVVVTYGQFDLVVKIEVDDFRRLDELVTKIRELDGVTSTITLIGS